MVLAECIVILDDVFPGPVDGARGAYRAFAFGFLSLGGVAAIVCAGVVVAVVVAVLRFECQALYRRDFDESVVEHVTAGILAVGPYVAHWVGRLE